MKFFIDTAEVAQIREIAELGFVDGVTTNPSLIAKSGRQYTEVVAELCEFIDGPISVETTALDYETMLQEGLKLAEIADNIVIKVPLTPDGLKTCRALREKGIMVNVTLCFSAAQALLAAKAGATFISPFVGRLDDIGEDGMKLIEEIAEVYFNYGFDTEILVASIRDVEHVKRAALIGADVATIPPKIVHELFKHPLTDKGIDMFLADWKKTGQSIL